MAKQTLKQHLAFNSLKPHQLTSEEFFRQQNPLLSDLFGNDAFKSWRKILAEAARCEEGNSKFGLYRDPVLKDKYYVVYGGHVFIVEGYDGKRLYDRFKEKGESLMRLIKQSSMALHREFVSQAKLMGNDKIPKVVLRDYDRKR